MNSWFLHPSAFILAFLNHQKADQLKIIQPRNIANQRRGFTAAKQAVHIFFLLYFDHRADGLAEQIGIGLHLAPVCCFLVETLAYVQHGLGLSFAAVADQVEQALDFGVVVDDLPGAVDVDEVVGVQPVVLEGGGADTGVAVAQGENDAGGQAKLRFGGDDGVHAAGHGVPFAVGMVEQVHAEVVQPQVGDGDAGFQVFQFDHFFLQAAQLLFAVEQVVRLCAQYVVVAGGADIDHHHSVFNALFEFDVFVQRNIGPVVDQLYAAVGRADAVYPAKALDDAHRVPVDVIVDQVIAVLQVLAFGDAIGANQQVDFFRFVR